MNESAKVSAEPNPDSVSLASRWLSYRRKRFWAVAVVLLYTLAGFFLVPALVTHFAVNNIKDSMDRDASITEVRFNPYVLSLQVNGFEISDKDGERLFQFDELFVNFQVSSLFRWAWTFREIHIDGLHLFIERFSPEDNRLSRLLDDMERLDDSPAGERESAGLPRLLIGRLALNEGSFLFRDHVPGETVDIPGGPVTVAIHDLNTLPDHSGRQSVQVRLSRGALLTWQGSLSLQPLASNGSLSLENLELDPLIPYLKSELPLKSIQATLSAHMDYTVEQHEAGPVSVSLDNLESQLADVLLTGLVPESEFLSFKALEISGGKLQFPEITLSIETIRLVDPFVDAWLGEDGQVGLLQLLPGGDRPSTAKEPASDWLISIDEFSVENGLVSASDRSIKPHATLGIEKISLNLTGIDNRANTTMPINMDLHLDEGGSVGFDGQVVTLPELMLSGKVSAADIPLVLAQPYVQQQLAIAVENGLFGTDFEIKLQADGAVQAAGELTVSELQIRDTVENEPLLAWERMVVDRYEVDSSAASAHLSSIRFDKPYGRIEINEDRRTNLGGLMPEKEEKVNSDEDGPVWSATVGGVAIDDGSMDFSDLSLPLHFATHITDLDGTISTIDSESAEPADIRLEGQVDQYGLARIKGSMNLLDPVDHTDVSVEFRNLLMTRLSPYTAEFAGREIDEGKLDLDLEYVINGGQLNGRNAVVLSDLVLGAKVDNPDAVSLPLGLAVALLKNSEGVIDIELPVEGDVNSPEFRIGGVIWKAFAGLITKVVSAPFKLLGSLIGIESEDFGQFQFLAGRHDLTPPEIEKIAQLQQALAQRPELSLEIGGVYDTAVDLPALQYESLRNTAIEHLGRNPAEEGNSEEMLGQEIRELFETLYRERFPDSPLEELKAAHSTPLEDDPDGKPVLDETAYAGDLRDRLIASEPLGEDELKQLASNRAKAVADAFQAGGELDPSRFRLTEPLETKSEDSEWIVMELGIATE